MFYSKIFSQAAGLLVTGWLLCACPFAAFAADDYLSALEAEASDATAEAPHVNRVKRVKAGKVLPDGLDFSVFEETLRTHYSGTYFLYAKLSRTNRKGVYRFYQADNRIAKMREEIVRRLASS